MSEVVALHGFAGSGRSWEGVRAGLLAPDLPGHGAAANEPVSLATCVATVLAAAPARFTLAGYSLGGRIALHAALAAPERIDRLVLISTTAGIEAPAERQARRAADDRLADEIQARGLEWFAGRWTAQPLFAGDPPEVRARQRDEILRNTPAGLAASLRGVGAGVLAPVWGRLGELRMPVTILAGARDVRYAALAERMAGALPDAEAPVVVSGAGHALVREAPGVVAAALRPCSRPGPRGAGRARSAP